MNYQYTVAVEWTGNPGEGTQSYSAYSREHSVQAAGKPTILCSSDPAYRGDATKYNPEELLVGSLAACHMLWYLHLCAVSGVVVTRYTDAATGTMEVTNDGGGHFTEVILKPEVTVQTTAMIAMAESLHARAHALCFIANSVNFKVCHMPTTKAEM